MHSARWLNHVTMGSFVAALLAAAPLGCAIEATSDVAPPFTTAADTDVGGTTTGGGESTGSSSGSSSGSTGAAAPGSCIRTCDEPADCCNENSQGCPGPYPLAVDCVGGQCVALGCGGDDECGQGLRCLPVDGVGRCVRVCEPPSVSGVANECATNGLAGYDCAGVSDTSDWFCVTNCTLTGCNSGHGDTCDVVTGRCTCLADDECHGDVDTCAPA